MDQKHILVIRLSAMGDVAMTVPVLKNALQQNPNLKITVLSKAFLKPLFDDIDRLHFYTADTNNKHKGILGIYKLYKELKALQFTAVADLHDVLRSKILRNFFKFSGTDVQFIDKGRADKKALCALENKVFKPLKTTHQRYADVFNSLGFKTPLNSEFKSTETLSHELKNLIQYQPDQKYIGIAPFAAHEGKKYPLALMKTVIGELAKNHTILLFGGGQQEIETLDKITSEIKNTINIAGKVKLKNELAIISNLNLMISMDSGNGHFSALYGIPTITIWGATHPYAGFVPFLQEQHCITADRNQYPLLPTSVYGNKIIEGYENVMKSVTPQQIIDKSLSITR